MYRERGNRITNENDRIRRIKRIGIYIIACRVTTLFVYSEGMINLYPVHVYTQLETVRLTYRRANEIEQLIEIYCARFLIFVICKLNWQILEEYRLGGGITINMRYEPLDISNYTRFSSSNNEVLLIIPQFNFS